MARLSSVDPSELELDKALAKSGAWTAGALFRWVLAVHFIGECAQTTVVISTKFTNQSVPTRGPLCATPRVPARADYHRDIVLSHNRNDTNAIRGISLIIKSREVAMKNAAHYRALASLCRQTAAYNSDKSWHLLGQAERWEHLAEAELASHFQECNSNGYLNSLENRAGENGERSRRETVAAA